MEGMWYVIMKGSSLREFRRGRYLIMHLLL
jgi:hypothetical protein